MDCSTDCTDKDFVTAQQVLFLTIKEMNNI